jgi:hypothetical protein
MPPTLSPPHSLTYCNVNCISSPTTCSLDNIIYVSTQAVQGPSLKMENILLTASRLVDLLTINRLDGNQLAIEASLSLLQDQTPRGQHCVLSSDGMTPAAGPEDGSVMDQTAPPWVVGPTQGTEAVNRRTSCEDTDQGSRRHQRSKMPGTKNLVRPSMGTEQELNGTLTKFLEPPTMLAIVPHPSTSLTRKTLMRL